MLTANNPTETRAALLKAAFRHVYRNGFRSSGLNDILSDTGVTKGALYHHFPNKDALGHALIEEFLTKGVKRLWIDPLEGSTDPVPELKEMIRKAADSLSDEEVALGCPLNNLALEMSPVDEGFRRRINEIYEGWWRAISEALEAGKTTGAVRESVDSDSAGRFVVASLAGCRGVGKNADSRAVMNGCLDCLYDYLDTLSA